MDLGLLERGDPRPPKPPLGALDRLPRCPRLPNVPPADGERLLDRGVRAEGADCLGAPVPRDPLGNLGETLLRVLDEDEGTRFPLALGARDEVRGTW